MSLLRCMCFLSIVFAVFNIALTESCTVTTTRFRISVNTSKGCLKPLNDSEGKDAVFLWDATKKVDQVTITIKSLIGTELIGGKWTLNGKVLSSRYERGRTTKSTITLKIKETMNVDDTGEYQVTSLKQASLTVNVTIGIESAPVMERKRKNVSVMKFPGEDAEIHCNVYGYPKPNVTWKVQDEDEQNIRNLTSRVVTNEAPPTYTVRIVNLDKSDRLWYICEASNKHGVRDTAQFLRVKDRFAWIIPLAVVIAQALIIINLTLCYIWTEKQNSEPSVAEGTTERAVQAKDTKISVAEPITQPANAAASAPKASKSAKAPLAKAKIQTKISDAEAAVDSKLQKNSKTSATDLSGGERTQSIASDRKAAGSSPVSTVKYRGHRTMTSRQDSPIQWRSPRYLGVEDLRTIKPLKSRPGYAPAASISRRRTAYGSKLPTVQFTPGTPNSKSVETEGMFGF